MYKPHFGSKKQIRFKDENEYYELLGYLAKSDGTSSLVWEHNEEQGAWASEGRIHLNSPLVPVSAYLSKTAGVGNVHSRVNCNEFVENLANNHGFVMGPIQDKKKIEATVPQEYLADFQRGLSL